MRTRPARRVRPGGRVVGVIGRLGMWLGVLLVAVSVLLAPPPRRHMSDLVSMSTPAPAAQLGWSGRRTGGQLGGSQSRRRGHHRARHLGSATRPPVNATAVVAGISDIDGSGVARTDAAAASAAAAVASVWVMAPKLIGGLGARWTSLSHQVARAARRGTRLAAVTPTHHAHPSTAATEGIGLAVLDETLTGPPVCAGQAVTPAYQRGPGRLFATSSTRPD